MEMNQTGYAEYLEHHGIKGQRWGIRRTPEQLGHRRKKDTTIYGSESGKKEKSSFSKFLDKRREESAKREQARKEADRKKVLAERAAKARKAKAAKQEERKKAEEKAKEEAKRREKIMKDPTLLLKYRDEFSTEEINKAVQRFNLERSLQELSLSKLSRGESYLRTAVKYANAGIDAYNIAARVANTFGNTDLPIIQKGEKKKDKGKDTDSEEDSSTVNTSASSNTKASKSTSNVGWARTAEGRFKPKKKKK